MPSNGTGLLSKDQLFAGKLKREYVDISKWWPEGRLLVREMTARERAEFSLSMIDDEGNVNIRAVGSGAVTGIAVMCTINEDGTPYFDQPDDAAKLGQISGGAIQAVADSVLKLSGLSESGLEEAKTESSIPSTDSP